MKGLIVLLAILLGLSCKIYSQDKIDYSELLDSIPSFSPSPIDSMDQEWAVKNGVIPPITKSGAEFELRYFIYTELLFQGRILVIKGYSDHFTVEKIGFAASRKAPSHWEKIKLLDGFTGPDDMALWRYHVKVRPREGWDKYILGIIESGLFSENSLFDEFVEIKKGSSFRRTIPIKKGQVREKKSFSTYSMLNAPLELIEPVKK